MFSKPGKVPENGQQFKNDRLFVVRLQVYTYKQNALSRQKVAPMHVSSISGVEDMSSLEDLHDGAIMYNLYLRYQHRLIYVSQRRNPC